MDTQGNSETPDSKRKHLNPLTPRLSRGFNSFSFPGMTPPQNATSMKHFPFAAVNFFSKFSTVVVGGIEFKGYHELRHHNIIR